MGKMRSGRFPFQVSSSAVRLSARFGLRAGTLIEQMTPITLMRPLFFPRAASSGFLAIRSSSSTPSVST